MKHFLLFIAFSVIPLFSIGQFTTLDFELIEDFNQDQTLFYIPLEDASTDKLVQTYLKDHWPEKQVVEITLDDTQKHEGRFVIREYGIFLNAGPSMATNCGTNLLIEQMLSEKKEKKEDEKSTYTDHILNRKKGVAYMPIPVKNSPHDDALIVEFAVRSLRSMLTLNEEYNRKKGLSFIKGLTARQTIETALSTKKLLLPQSMVAFDASDKKVKKNYSYEIEFASERRYNEIVASRSDDYVILLPYDWIRVESSERRNSANGAVVMRQYTLHELSTGEILSHGGKNVVQKKEFGRDFVPKLQPYNLKYLSYIVEKLRG